MAWSPKEIYEQCCNPIYITKASLESIFRKHSLNISRVFYRAEPNEDPFFEAIFTQVKEDLQYKETNERSSHHLSKGRLYMIRRAMEIYSHISPKEHNQLRYIRNRLTRSDRDLLAKAGLPSPPCRLTTAFQEELFSNRRFAAYFVCFVQEGRLEEVLLERSEKEIVKFREHCQQIAGGREGPEEKMRRLMSNPPPLSLLEVELYLEEAQAILKKYCQ
jgi:hypothetical protein